MLKWSIYNFFIIFSNVLKHWSMVYRKVEHNNTSDYEKSEHSEDTEANSQNLDSKLSERRKRRTSEHRPYLDD